MSEKTYEEQYNSLPGTDVKNGLIAQLIHVDFNSGTTTQASREISYQTDYERQFKKEKPKLRKDLRDKMPFDQIRNKAEKELIDSTYQSIVDALDNEINQIESSNLFDEWKDYMELVMAEVDSLNVNHRKILGATMIAIKGKDIADFSGEDLKSLRDITYMLRDNRLNQNDSKRIINKLLDMNDKLAIPIAVDNITEAQEKNLDEMMNTLIQRSK